MSDDRQHHEITRADLEALKQDLRTEVQETEARIAARVEHQIQETEARIAARVEHQIQETEARITNNLVERMRDMQTELLRGFER